MKEFVEKLIERLSNQYLKYDDGDWNDAIDRSIKIVKDLASEQNNGWKQQTMGRFERVE